MTIGAFKVEVLRNLAPVELPVLVVRSTSPLPASDCLPQTPYSSSLFLLTITPYVRQVIYASSDKSPKGCSQRNWLHKRQLGVYGQHARITRCPFVRAIIRATSQRTRWRLCLANARRVACGPWRYTRSIRCSITGELTAKYFELPKRVILLALNFEVLQL